MKRYLTLLCCAVLILSLCACNKDTGNLAKDDFQRPSLAPTNSVENNSEGTPKLPTDSVEQETADSTLQTVPESLTERITRQMEEAFEADAKLPEYTSTAGMCSLYDKYTEKWRQIADEYYDKIMAYEDLAVPGDVYYTAEDLHIFAADLKTNWEQYAWEQYDIHIKILETIYQGGSIIGPLSASYRCNQYKEWALELISLCQALDIA